MGYVLAGMAVLWWMEIVFWQRCVFSASLLCSYRAAAMVAIRLPDARKGTNGRNSILFVLVRLFLWFTIKVAATANPEAANRMNIMWEGPWIKPIAAASLMSPPPIPQPSGDAMAAAKRIRKPVAAPASEYRKAGGSACRNRDKDNLASSVDIFARALPMQSALPGAINESAVWLVSNAFRNGAVRAIGQKRSSTLSGTRLVRRSCAANPAMQAKTSSL